MQGTVSRLRILKRSSWGPVSETVWKETDTARDTHLNDLEFEEKALRLSTHSKKGKESKTKKQITHKTWFWSSVRV
jgi:hypothetical protein